MPMKYVSCGIGTLDTIERASKWLCRWRIVVIETEKGRLVQITDTTELRNMKDGSIIQITDIRSQPMRNSYPDIQIVAKVLDNQRNFRHLTSFGGDWLADALDELQYVIRQNQMNPIPRCTCYDGNWASLGCPLHGLDAR